MAMTKGHKRELGTLWRLAYRSNEDGYPPVSGVLASCGSRVLPSRRRFVARLLTLVRFSTGEPPRNRRASAEDSLTKSPDPAAIG